jgi:hypothetical protein
MRGVGDRPEVDESDAILERRNKDVSNSDSDSSLANASGSHDRNEPIVRQPCRKRYDRVGSPDNAAEWGWELVELATWSVRFRWGKIPLGSVHRGHEAVSAARNIGDETVAVLTVTERFA